MADESTLLKELQKNLAKQHAASIPNSAVENVEIPLKPKKDSPVAFYDSNHKHYWMQNSRGDWIDYTEGSLKRYLEGRVYSNQGSKDLRKWYVDQHMIETQLKLDVSFAGPLAGYQSGVVDVCRKRILVTESPKRIRPFKGNWNTLKAFLGQLLGEQMQYFDAWVKSSNVAFDAGPPFRPGQLLAIAGPAGCGKSLAQNLLTEMFGGRAAKPYPFMVQRTEFNEELFYAEHLLIEDEAASTDIRVRRNFGNAIKSMIVNETQMCYPKGKRPRMFTPFWRLSITLNDEPENLSVLPPLDESLRDKIILLRAFHVQFPFGDDDIGGRQKFRDQLSRELPCYLHYLQNWKMPKALASQRYGCVAWQNAELLDALDDLTPEAKLLVLIDTLQPWKFDDAAWEGTASSLEDILLEKDKMGRVAKLLSFNTACGVYLARLIHRHPERIVQMPRHGNRAMWRIVKPNAP